MVCTYIKCLYLQIELIMVPIIDFRTIGVMYSYWLLCTLTVTIA